MFVILGGISGSIGTTLLLQTLSKMMTSEDGEGEGKRVRERG